MAYHIPDLELPTEVTRQPDLPSDAEAEKIALAFLEKTGMQSPDARVVKTEVNQKQEAWEAGATEPKVSYDITKQSGSAGHSTDCRSMATNSRRSWVTAARSSGS
ncbi:hypothetical protein [Methanoculleus chikugoensis]|uniref:hypothetical protein n=1 Tax=Methanoculleus chikugoensis TaxID=118126 RepID=UPI001FB44934|nr:hypothetical protein [Methanoculleus chikugoensis]